MNKFRENGGQNTLIIILMHLLLLLYSIEQLSLDILASLYLKTKFATNTGVML